MSKNTSSTGLHANADANMQLGIAFLLSTFIVVSVSLVSRIAMASVL